MALCWKGACATEREMRQSTLEADEPGVGNKSDSRLGNAGVGDKYRTFSKKQLRSLRMFVNWEERQARRERRADHFIDKEANAGLELARKEAADVESAERRRFELPYSQLIEGGAVVVGQAEVS